MGEQHDLPTLREKARRALAGYDWDRAVHLLGAIDATGALTAEELEWLGEAWWWKGQARPAVEAKERAFAAYVHAGEDRRAGKAALNLYDRHMWTGKPAVARSWLGQADRLLSPQSDCAERGYLDLWKGVDAYYRGEYGEAVELTDRALACAVRYADRDLEAMATAAKGDALFHAGDRAEGMELIEAAAAMAVSGSIDLYLGGLIYCILLHNCDAVGDYRRAAQWAEAAVGWCERTGVGHFGGACRLVRAHLMEVQGDFGRAEEEARRACEELQDLLPRLAGVAKRQEGLSRLHLGDLVGAERAFLEAQDLGASTDLGLAQLSLARGELERAVAAVDRLLSQSEPGDVQRARFLPLRMELAEAMGDGEAASHTVEELQAIAEEYATDALRATASKAETVLHLMRQEAEAAERAARQAIELWEEAEAPYQVARTRLLLGRALRLEGDEEGADLELTAARRSFERLGARPDLDRCQRLLAATGRGERVQRAFMFTDIVASSLLIEVLGDDGWVSLRGWHDRTLGRLFAEYEGQEVEHTGDGFFVVFPDSDRAVRCARAIQDRLARHRAEQGFAPQVRIGIHTGEATLEERTFSGKAVHAAARIAELAEGGEILVSEAVLATVDVPSGELREVELEGLRNPIVVSRVLTASGA